MWINGGAAHTGAEQGLGVGSSYFREVNMVECKECTDTYLRLKNRVLEVPGLLDYGVHVATEHRVVNADGRLIGISVVIDPDGDLTGWTPDLGQ